MHSRRVSIHRSAIGAALLGLLGGCSELPSSPSADAAAPVPFPTVTRTVATAIEDVIARILPTFEQDAAVEELRRTLDALLQTIEAGREAELDAAITAARTALAAPTLDAAAADLDVIHITLEYVEGARAQQ